MQYFRYVDNELFCEDVSLRELADEFGTPLYVYSKGQIVSNYQELDQALAGVDHVTCYALKANSNPVLLKLLAKEGAGADVVSAGELYLALKGGFPAKKITFAGVGKRQDELEYALKEDIHSFNVESLQELQLLSLVALHLQTTARVSLRINPDIDAQSHPYIMTGLSHNKFGIEGSKAVEAFEYGATLPGISLMGIHTHIGSQITKVEPFVDAARYIAHLVEEVRGKNINLTHIDFGGGIGVQYPNALTHEALPVEDMPNGSPAPLRDFAAAIVPILQPTNCSIWLEPGRSIVANAGVLLTKVLFTKENSTKKFVIVDAGMNDLLRPSLYNAHHQIVPTTIESTEHEQADVVGPICETGDFLARERMLVKAKRNDYLSVMTTGAYGYVNASNYNSRLRPAEILVNGEKVRVIRERQTLDQL